MPTQEVNASPRTFEEWAEQRLGPYVWGVNDQEWEKSKECWEAAQLAMLIPLLGAKEE